MVGSNMSNAQFFDNQREFDEKRAEGRAANMTKKRQYQDDDRSLDGFQSCNASQAKNSPGIRKSSRPTAGKGAAQAELSDSAKKALADFMNTGHTGISEQQLNPVVSSEPE